MFGRPGGFNNSDRAALGRLEETVGPRAPREGARARVDDTQNRAASLRRLAARGGGADVLVFTCDMLQRAVGQDGRGSEQGAQQSGWATLTCDDEDDYEALLKQSCASEGLAPGGAVVLLRGDEEDRGPLSDDWYVRHGRVEWIRRQSRAAPKGRVCLQLFEHPRWGAAVREVQMAPVGESGATTWRVFGRVRRGRRGAMLGGRRGFSGGQKGVQFKLPKQLNAELAKGRYGIHARAKRALALNVRRGALKSRKASAERNAQLAVVEASLLRVRGENERAKRKCDVLEEQVRQAPLPGRAHHTGRITVGAVGAVHYPAC